MMNLATYLETTGITQAGFAEQIGLTQGAVSKLCASSQPSFQTAARIEEVSGGKVPIEAWPRFAVLKRRKSAALSAKREAP